MSAAALSRNGRKPGTSFSFSPTSSEIVEARRNAIQLSRERDAERVFEKRRLERLQPLGHGDGGSSIEFVVAVDRRFDLAAAHIPADLEAADEPPHLAARQIERHTGGRFLEPRTRLVDPESLRLRDGVIKPVFPLGAVKHVTRAAVRIHAN